MMQPIKSTFEAAIDGRSLKEKDVFLQLKEIFQEHAEEEILLEVSVNNPELARKIMSFSAISHLSTKARKEGDHCVVTVSGSPCRCG